jgi:Protein of unknown function (DUF3060)
MRYMKIFVLCSVAILLTLVQACDVQSGITKKSVEKYAPSPTPEKTVEVVEQIDPADVVTVDVAVEGPQLSINKGDNKTTLDCNKYNRVQINDDARNVTIKGVCKRLMINGDRNQVAAAVVSEIALNGFGNTVQYSKYANGKKPVITDNGRDNTISKTSPETPQK